MDATTSLAQCDDENVAVIDSPPLIGRITECSNALAALRTGHSVLVKGQPGIGKRALLRALRSDLGTERICLWPTLATPKRFAAELAEQVHQAIGLAVPESLIPPRFRAEARRTGRVAWRHIQRSIARQPAAEAMLLVIDSIDGRSDVVLFVETLALPPSHADMLHQLAEHCQLAAAIEIDNRRARIVKLLWRFQLTIELKPLISPESRALVEQLLEKHPISFETAKVRDAFITQVSRESRGIPAAIAGMVESAANEREVTRATVREYRHDAAVTYIDMTPLLLILVAVLMALRYISRGAGIQELMVLAGVGTSLFSLLLFFARRMSARG